MSRVAPEIETREETPVDDVRQVRRRLSSEAKGDIRAQIEVSRKVAEQYKAELGLQPDSDQAPRSPCK